MASTKSLLIKSVLVHGLSVLVLLISSASVINAARPAPIVEWNITSFRPNESVKTSKLALTNSSGKQTWSAKGSCSIRRNTLRVKSEGTCTVTLRLGADKKFSARTFVRKFKITTVVSVIVYDPYAGTTAGVPATGTKSLSQVVTSDGRTRRYRTYVPTNLPSGQLPLLIALHGGLGTSEQFEANSGFDDLAEANKFVVAYPDGIGSQSDGTGFQTWNGGYCCGPAQTQDVDDVAFIGRLIDTLVTQLPIDTKRVFIAGHSNGGILAYRLACELSEKIAAIGLQAGSNVVRGCAPSRAVPVMHIHGSADTNVPIGGGRGSGLSTTLFVSAQAAVDAMIAANRCSTSYQPSKSVSDSNVTAKTWTCIGTDIQVRLVTVSTATHAWMGHAAQSQSSLTYVGTPYLNFDSSRAIWSFFASHSRS